MSDMNTRVTDLCRNVLMQGRGLRPVLRFARKQWVDAIRIDHVVCPVRREQGFEAAITFYFASNNGGAHAEAVTYWQSVSVFFDWLQARRSWDVERVRFASTASDMFDKCSALPTVAKLRKRGTSIVPSPSPCMVY